MGKAVQAMASPLSTVGKAVGVGGDVGKALNFMDASTHPFEQTAANMFNAKKPDAPAINSNLGKVKSAQEQNAASFRANLPVYQSQLSNRLGAESNQMLGENLQDIRQNQSGRGLLYGGVTAGKEQRARSQASGALAQGRTDINQGLMNQANLLDAQAINTGYGVQQTQQSIQNNIYSQALADLQSRSAAMGGLMGGVGKIGGMLAGGG